LLLCAFSLANRAGAQNNAAPGDVSAAPPAMSEKQAPPQKPPLPEPKPAASADSKPAETKAPEASKPLEHKSAETKPNADNKPSREQMPKADDTEPSSIKASNVTASYEIKWLGTYIGDFKLRSSITNRQYSLQANADISVFFGTVSWKGVTSSRGLMTANGPMPQSYSFRYSTGEKGETVDLRFQQRSVQDIVINPPPRPGSRRVPITAAHLQNVVDPLSAVILLSQARPSRRSENVCSRRIPIFDGKMRYDLVLTPKGTKPIGNAGKLHGTAYVCSVHYIPIAGHKPGNKTEEDYMAASTGIEVWLVPVPEAGLVVPYYISVPTPAGTASIMSAKFEFETPSGRHALID